MVGQNLTSVVLQQMVKNNSVPSALLFDGPRGTGKTSAARILAMELNPDEREGILAGNSLAILEIDAASHGSVADIRALTEQLDYSVVAGTRVVILDEVHSVTREGFNALLKTLEEPPENVVFVLVTTEPSRIPDTIMSRAMEFKFRRVTPKDLLSLVVRVAEKEEIALSQELAVKLAETADGSARDVIKNLDFVSWAEITTVDQFTELIGEQDFGPLLLASLATGDHARIFKVMDKLLMETGDPGTISTALTDVMVDLFILKSGGHVTAAGQALDYRVKLSKAIPSDNLYSAIQILWDLKTKVRWSEDRAASLATALVLVADKLAKRKVEEIKTDTPAPVSSIVLDNEDSRPLTLSEIQQM